MNINIEGRRQGIEVTLFQNEKRKLNKHYNLIKIPGQVQINPHLSQAILFPIGLVDVQLLCINSNLNVMIRHELVPLSKFLHKV